MPCLFHRPDRVLMRLGIAVCFVASFGFVTISSAQDTAEPRSIEAGGEAAMAPTARGGATAPASILDEGFHKLYELKFKEGREQFLSYQKMDPDDPMGKVAEAASYLYEQFNARGIFTSEFFLNDQKFLGGVAGSASENRNDKFLEANRTARDMANQRLRADPRDKQGLLVLAMTDGMEADYDALIIKKQMNALGLTKQADAEALKLLAIDPQAEDAYMALGAANYIIGCLPGFKRAFLWFGGVHGDRERGMEQLQRTAEHGHYLKPFAKAWLALAYEREHQPEQARILFSQLAAEFPENPIFARELSLLDHPAETK